MRTEILALLCFSFAGCASGSALRGDVSGLGTHPHARIAVDVDADGHLATQEAVRAGAQAALAHGGAVGLAAPNQDRELRLRLRVLHAPSRQSPGSGDGFPAALALLRGDDPERLHVRGELTDRDGVLLGRIDWEGAGADPAAAGAAIARAIDASAAGGPDPFVIRRASDERMFLTPTALTLSPGAVELGDDEVLALRLAVGLSHRVQLDLTAGALPVPFAGATALPGPGILVGGGGVGLALGTMIDLGVKVRLLDEGRVRPGLAVSYDLLDAAASLGAAVGGGGVGGNGAAAGGGVGAGTVNFQFNLFTVAATKHLGRHRITLGTYVLDNHHFLPQSAGAAGVLVGASLDGGAAGAAVGASTGLDRVPLQVQPFASYAYDLGPHSLLAVEAFPWTSLRPVLGTTGVRWTLGNGEKVLGLDLQRTAVRIDLALVWLYARGDASKGQKGTVGYFPWLGVGLAFN